MAKLFLLLLLVSCATKPKLKIQVDDTKNDPEISKLLKKFHIKTNTPIMFRDMKKRYVALCKRYKDRRLNVIHINKKEWDKTSEAQKKLVLIHEIGHCDKNLDHNDELLPDKYPASIMHYKIFSSKCFNKYEKKYIEEVFGLNND